MEPPEQEVGEAAVRPPTPPTYSDDEDTDTQDSLEVNAPITRIVAPVLIEDGVTWEEDADDIVEIRETLQDKAISNRKYPQHLRGDSVKLFRKPGKFAEMKEGFNHWTTRTYEVSSKWVEDGMPVFSRMLQLPCAQPRDP